MVLNWGDGAEFGVWCSQSIDGSDNTERFNERRQNPAGPPALHSPLCAVLLSASHTSSAILWLQLAAFCSFQGLPQAWGKSRRTPTRSSQRAPPTCRPSSLAPSPRYLASAKFQAPPKRPWAGLRALPSKHPQVLILPYKKAVRVWHFPSR
eukprot:2388259-Rhodomonas_salina.1